MSRFSRLAETQFEFNAVPNADGDADIVYLNLDIINNNVLDPQAASQQDPQIRFNETRDAPIVKDASKYQFSIVRFTMSGANKDLPLFIPVIRTQPTVPPIPGVLPQNITEYEMAIGFQQGWQTTDFPGGITITALPPVNPVIYIPETQNPVIAPLPRDPTLGQGQDLTTRYYWVYTYSRWVDLVNLALAQAWANTFAAFQVAWAATTVDPFPYANFQAWQVDAGTAPQMRYDETTGLFSLVASQKTFGDRLTAFTPPVAPTTPLDPGTSRLFFDSNMFGLFSNFDNVYYGGPSAGIQGPYFPLPTPTGYVNEILFRNKQYQNVIDLRPQQSPSPGYPLQGPNLLPVPSLEQDIYWVQTQDIESTSSLWSPVSSIVFTSTLLPVRTEAAGQPITFGSGNLGYSSSAIQNAFQPIVTDIALDLAASGGDAYRRMVFYAPQAEYRMASMTPSRQPINSIDIAVFWKNRLDGNLYPLTMYNQSSVAIKCMFRRIRE